MVFARSDDDDDYWSQESNAQPTTSNVPDSNQQPETLRETQALYNSYEPVPFPAKTTPDTSSQVILEEPVALVSPVKSDHSNVQSYRTDLPNPTPGGSTTPPPITSGLANLSIVVSPPSLPSPTSPHPTEFPPVSPVSHVSPIPLSPQSSVSSRLSATPELQDHEIYTTSPLAESSIPSTSNSGKIVTTELEYYSEFPSPLPLPSSQFNGTNHGRHSLSSSVGSYAGTDSSASLSTGRRSPQSFAPSNRESYDQKSFRFSTDSALSEGRNRSSADMSRENRKSADTPFPVLSNWKPLDNIAEPKSGEPSLEYSDTPNSPNLTRQTSSGGYSLTGLRTASDTTSVPLHSTSTVNDSYTLLTPTLQQNALERDIMNSFSNSSRTSPAPVSSPLDLQKDDVASSPVVPDTEISALYRDTTQFLNGSMSHRIDSNFPETRPLTSIKSRENRDSVSNINTSLDDYGFQSVKPINRRQSGYISPVHEDPRSSGSWSGNSSPVTSTSSAKSDSSDPHSTSWSQTRQASNHSLPHIETNDTVASINTDHFITPASTKVADKLNRPPLFDFKLILSKPHSEDRIQAFDEARQREASYESGLRTWLHQTSNCSELTSLSNSNFSTTTFSSASHPSVLRTKSISLSTVLNPSAFKHGISGKLSRSKVGSISKGVGERSTQVAKDLTGKISNSKVGEKSSQVAKGLFQRGRRFMKSSNGQ